MGQTDGRIAVSLNAPSRYGGGIGLISEVGLRVAIGALCKLSDVVQKVTDYTWVFSQSVWPRK